MRNIFLAVFAVSGFSGLIYESIWSHYLKLFLGHAAYAQTLVLAIFMGGMAIGAWLCSRYSGSWPRLIRAYAVVEGIIGICALAFHPVFQATVGLAFERVIPQLGSPAEAAAVKWGLGAFLILPQSILLGMTFPLMSAGIIRRFPENPGATLSMLYFTNSLGGAIGVLASGFVMIDLMGLPGTVACAGAINILLAVLVWWLAGPAPESAAGSAAARAGPASAPPVPYLAMIGVAFFTGLASFIYEIGWIRMLSLVLGSSTHAFELMLSAFIFGLAAGGLWIRRRIDRVTEPVKWLAALQILMGAFALATLPVYNLTFDAMQGLLQALPRTGTGYRWYSIGSHGIAFAVMLPAAFCAGTTLPLITYVLLRGGHGEKSIGSVYAANTVGAIIGVFLALHIALPALGLKGLIASGAAVDMGLGVALLWLARGPAAWRLRAAGAAAAVAMLGASLAWFDLDPYRMASGVFRSGKLLTPLNAEIVRQIDGKTATVHLTREQGDILALRTNGKVDASVYMGEGRIQQDETTMVLTGALPLLMHPGAKSAANIGFGSGLTTHVLLSAGRLERLDTIEIEPAVVEAARAFHPRNALAYADPRSEVHIEDAKTFFSSRNRKYDLVVSEPSNPWVSGVAGLFSQEFFRLAAGQLTEGGVLVQWLHLYETDMEIVVSVLKALASVFEHYAIYAANSADVIIVARNGAPLPPLDAGLYQVPAFARELERVGLPSVQDVELRRIATGSLLAPLLAALNVPANSDFRPIVDQRAERARFLGRGPRTLISLGSEQVPLLDMLGARAQPARTPATIATPSYRESVEVHAAVRLRDAVAARATSSLQNAKEEGDSAANLLEEIVRLCATGGGRAGALLQVAVRLANRLSAAEAPAIWEWVRTQPCGSGLTAGEKEWMALLEATSARDARQMAALGEKLLASEAGLPADGLSYAVAATMLGHLVNGEKEPAQRVWRRYGSRLFPGREPTALFLILAAHSFAR